MIKIFPLPDFNRGASASGSPLNVTSVSAPMRFYNGTIQLLNQNNEIVSLISTDGTFTNATDLNLATQKAVRDYIALMGYPLFTLPLLNTLGTVALVNDTSNTITQVSTDVNFIDNSDLKIPTQHAIKAYVAPAINLVEGTTLFLKDGLNHTIDVVCNGSTATQFSSTAVTVTHPLIIQGATSYYTLKDNILESLELIRTDGLGDVTLLTSNLLGNIFSKGLDAPGLILRYDVNNYVTFEPHDFSDISVTPSNGGTWFYNGPMNINSSNIQAFTTVGGGAFYLRLTLDGGLEFSRAHTHLSTITIDMNDQMVINPYLGRPLLLNAPLTITSTTLPQVIINDGLTNLSLGYSSGTLTSDRAVHITDSTDTSGNTTGSFITDGGMYIAKSLIVGPITTWGAITMTDPSNPSATITYNGTSILINKPTSVTTSLTIRSVPGTQTQSITIDGNNNLTLSNPRWVVKDVFDMMKGSATWDNIGVLDFFGWKFTAGGQKLYGSMQIGGDFAGATLTAVLNINWMTANATVGTVHWRMELNYAAPGGIHSAVVQTIEMPFANGASAYVNLRSSSAQFTLASPAKGGQVLFRMLRVSDAVDTYPNDAWLTGCAFQVLCDKIIGNHNSA